MSGGLEVVLLAMAAAIVVMTIVVDCLARRDLHTIQIDIS